MRDRFTWFSRYSSQLWLLFWGTLTGSMGQSLIWPFLSIYISRRLAVPLTTITLLFTLQSLAGFAATALLGPLMDRAGRRKPMIGGLVASGLTLLLMSQATTLLHWVILLPLYGMVNSVFRIGSYSMVADMVGPERRAEVYALLRMGDNLGITVGPALGGFLVTIGYALSYTVAAATQFVLAAFVGLIIRETLPGHLKSDGKPDPLFTPRSIGYGPMLHDYKFLAVWGLNILVQIANAMVFVLLGLYVKDNFSIPESGFGFIVGTNAAMVVLFQYGISRLTNKRPVLTTMALGALLYTLGLTAFALSQAFAGFLLGMVILTSGEMLFVPTGTALVAAIAPPDMRARYIGLFSQSFRVGSGIGPVVGGFLSEHVAPVAMWYSGAGFCLAAALGYAMLSRRTRNVIFAAQKAPAETLQTP
jgi:MFS family permease